MVPVDKSVKQYIALVLVILLFQVHNTLSHKTTTDDFDTDELSDENITDTLNWQGTDYAKSLRKPNDANEVNLKESYNDFESEISEGFRPNHSNWENGVSDHLEQPVKSSIITSSGIPQSVLRKVRGADALSDYVAVNKLPFHVQYGSELQPVDLPLNSSLLKTARWHPREGSTSPVMLRTVAKRYGRVRHARRRNILANIKKLLRPKVPLKNDRNVLSLKVPLQKLVNPDDAFIIDRNGVVHRGHMNYRQFVRPIGKVLEKKNQPMVTDGPQLNNPVKRNEPMTTAQSTPSSSEANKPTDAVDTSKSNTQSNGTSQEEPKSVVKGGSHQYQVMANSKNASNNETGRPNGTLTEEAAKKNMLKQIIAELEQFKSHAVSGPVVIIDNTACSIFGSWISDAGGVRFDISVANGSKSLNVSMAPTIPPKKDAWFNESEWNITGEIPFTEKGAFTLTAIHKTQHITALFIGQCMVCMGEELVAGTWTTGRSARDCRDTIVAYSERPDVFRKEVLHILRAQKKIQLASKVNKTTTTVIPSTEAPKKVKRWWTSD